MRYSGDKMDSRYKIALSFITLVFVIIILRLYYLGIISHEKYLQLAQNNTIKTEIRAQSRGFILDRNKKPLALNSLGYSIALNPYLCKKKNCQALERELANITNIFSEFNIEELKKIYLKNYSSYNHNYINIIDWIPYDAMLAHFTRLSLNPNIRINIAEKRKYPHKTTASHIIGYIGKISENDAKTHIDHIGKTGLEKHYNDFLSGELRTIKTKVNVLNQVVEIIDNEDAKDRFDLITSLDIELQKHIDNEFSQKAGAVIVMNAHNGEILASGSYPEYDLNKFIDGMTHEEWELISNSVDNPLSNKLINGLYPPGSVIKMGMGLSFLEHGDINEKTVIETPPFITLSGINFRDWKAEGHGSSDLIKALKRSVDVYFYRLAYRIGIQNMVQTLGKMGFGDKSGIDLPNESSGILPSPSWKLANRGENWRIGDTINASIGQGLFLTTPMQIARYTALMASGKLPTPHYAKKLGEKDLIYEPKDVLDSFLKSKLPAIARGMYEACNAEDGTAYRATRASKIILACKTGTAQVVGIPQDVKRRAKESEMEYLHRSHAWITAFAPYQNPKFVITILIEHGGSGSAVAGPILASIANKMNALGYFKKDENDR